jgi:hypothetical protein
MNNNLINKAIAKAVGWESETSGPSWYEYETKMPNYAGCLNAMHDAEKGLNPIKAAEYARMLISIAWESEQPIFAPMTATARQRAEAFLRTLGKWEEEA